MSFCTVINCMDGRVQLPAIKYLQERFNAAYVDSITEPGPILTLSEEKDTAAFQSIKNRLQISIEAHNSLGVAVVGHHDCAGNPAPEAEQRIQIKKAVQRLQRAYAHLDIIGLWINENWAVQEVEIPDYRRS